MSAPDLYSSCDVEADGPIPGPYSMISFGLSVAGEFDGASFTHRHPFERTFYAELKPISDGFVPEALAVSGLDRDDLIVHGQDPVAAMTAAAEWVRAVAAEARAFPVFARGRAQIRDSVKAKMPRRLLSRRRHTHHALDDAVEQAELLQNLMTWTGHRP